MADNWPFKETCRMEHIPNRPPVYCQHSKTAALAWLATRDCTFVCVCVCVCVCVHSGGGGVEEVVVTAMVFTCVVFTKCIRLSEITLAKSLSRSNHNERTGY